MCGGEREECRRRRAGRLSCNCRERRLTSASTEGYPSVSTVSKPRLGGGRPTEPSALSGRPGGLQTTRIQSDTANNATSGSRSSARAMTSRRKDSSGSTSFESTVHGRRRGVIEFFIMHEKKTITCIIAPALSQHDSMRNDKKRGWRSGWMARGRAAVLAGCALVLVVVFWDEVGDFDQKTETPSSSLPRYIHFSPLNGTAFPHSLTQATPHTHRSRDYESHEFVRSIELPTNRTTDGTVVVGKLAPTPPVEAGPTAVPHPARPTEPPQPAPGPRELELGAVMVRWDPNTFGGECSHR